MKSFLIALALLLAPAAALACPAYPYQLTNGQTADANQVMANFNNVLTCVNGLATAGANSNITSLSGLTTPLSVFQGGTGSTTGITQTSLGGPFLVVANNLSDVASTTAARTNLGAAPLASPGFTGVPTAPTAAPGTNTTQIATTAFVNTFGSGTYAPLASPALTGTPTAPTAPAGTNSTQIATTAFVTSGFTASPGTTGYTQLPNGLILEWGSVTSFSFNGGVKAVSLPLTFPNAALSAQVTLVPPSTGGSDTYAATGMVSGLTASTITLFVEPNTSNAHAGVFSAYWFAIGY